MAKKTDTTKVILIVAGGAAALYFLTRPEVKEKIQGTMSSLLPNITFAPVEISDLAVPNMEEILKQCQAPSLTDLLPSEFPNLLPSLPDLFQPSQSSTTQPPDHATWADVAYSLPTWAKGAIGVVGAGLAGYGGYQAIRFSAPVLRAIGTQAAKGIGGAGSLIARWITGRTTTTVVSGQVVKSVPTAAAVKTGGILGGLLPALAFTGIAEGAYQIFRMIRGEGQIGMTGVPPLDIVNFITGKFTPGELTPSLLLPDIGVVAAANIPITRHKEYAKGEIRQVLGTQKPPAALPSEFYKLLRQTEPKEPTTTELPEPLPTEIYAALRQ